MPDIAFCKTGISKRGDDSFFLLCFHPGTKVLEIICITSIKYNLYIFFRCDIFYFTEKFAFAIIASVGWVICISRNFYLFRYNNLMLYAQNGSQRLCFLKFVKGIGT